MNRNHLINMIKDYGIDVQDELLVSPFEYQYMFITRDNIAEHYNLLDIESRKLLSKYDKILLKKSNEFYEYLKPIKIWGNNKSPINYWWWHLDKIVNGEMNVLLIKNKVIYRKISYDIVKL